MWIQGKGKWCVIKQALGQMKNVRGAEAMGLRVKFNCQVMVNGEWCVNDGRHENEAAAREAYTEVANALQIGEEGA